MVQSTLVLFSLAAKLPEEEVMGVSVPEQKPIAIPPPGMDRAKFFRVG